MTTIIAIFIFALLLSIGLTPIVIRIAMRYGLVDTLSKRKVHNHPMPRIGGIAIYFSFFLPFSIVLFMATEPLNQVVLNKHAFTFFAGATIVFILGLIDDFIRLKPGIKFIAQAAAASVAFAGGIQIGVVDFVGAGTIELDLLSFPVTIFWFLFFINAINLIDGLDGLAAGVAFFVSIILMILTITQGKILIALLLASLAGATLGFLRYNFHPAKIFMGDCGSYFLGFCLAALIIVGSIKGQTTVAIFIPIIAMGVPFIDTFWAPIRRFILGKRMFSPDGEHLHHRLMKLGLSHRNAVMMLYGATIIFGGLALAMVHAKDERAALILVVIGLFVIFSIRKLGYLNFIDSGSVKHWIDDVSDEVGISRERRSFLNLQVGITSARDFDELWEKICEAVEWLEFDLAEMRILDKQSEFTGQGCYWWKNGNGRFGADSEEKLLKRKTAMKLELPLTSKGNGSYGTLWLLKDLKRDPVTHYTLRRIEHLRRSVIGAIERM